MFSCEYCKIFKNNFFEEDLQTIASDYLSENTSKRLFNSNFVQIFISTICFRVVGFSGSRSPIPHIRALALDPRPSILIKVSASSTSS